MNDQVREATYEERATWGTCPVCQAGPGQRCDPNVGFAIGYTVTGEPPQDGVHIGRLQGAPMRVKLVAA